MAKCSNLSSPGPAAYLLPTLVGYEKHDQRRTRRPQYSFGVRTAINLKGIGPGPAAYNPKKVTNFGPENTLAFSLGGRTKITGRGVGPGPANYNASSGLGGPAFSIGIRTQGTKGNRNPGPNTYAVNVKPIKPGTPAFSFGRRIMSSSKGKSPGPAAYGSGHLNMIRKKSPAYIMGIRTAMQTKRHGPGANNYNLQHYKPGDKGPAYSFGTKHSPCAPPLVVECDN